MNARELHDKLEYEHKAGLRWLFSSDAQERETILRALRLLAAAEGGEGTPETDAVDKELGVGESRAGDAGRYRALSIRLERERNGLAARVGELEKDAERYRFLKDGLWDDYLTGVIEMRKDAIWDAAIDAARSK